MKKLGIILAVCILVWGCGARENEYSTNPPPQAQQPLAAVSGQTEPSSLVQEGIDHLQDAEIAEAISSFDNAIRQDPLNPDPYIILGETYLRLKNYSRAVDTFSAAERIAPQRGDIQYFLAIGHGLMGKEDLAKVHARKSIELFRQDEDEENFLKAVALLQGLLAAK